jgi:hypothetical protein
MVRGPQKQCSRVSDMQIHKYNYTNTVWVKFANRPNICYIFEKVMVQGPQKQCSRVCDKQIHKYNYTNTQIQFGSNLQIDLMCYIFEKVMVRGPQKQYSRVSDMQIHKYSLGQICR